MFIPPGISTDLRKMTTQNVVSILILCHLSSSRFSWKHDGKTDIAPNIVLVIADDLGWADVGFNRRLESSDPNLRVPETPHLDKAAKEGLILENLYTQAACTPTRGSLMTGKYAYRLGKLFAASIMTSSDKKGPSDRFLSEVSKFMSSAFSSVISKSHSMKQSIILKLKLQAH